MSKILVIDYNKCHGCRECETACAMINKINSGTSKARITAVTLELEGKGVPIVCQHCQDAPCLAVCPQGALYQDRKLNRVMVNYDRCIGCRVCMAVCPFGAMDFDGEVRKVVKCNLCDGDPLCAELCSYGALQYLCIMEQSILKKMEVADKIKGILSNRKADKGD